ncbi:energy transducer TonB [Pseudoxanthomonas broegbernensis]|nr:energy transducer TonB [Pseudoxanthomonas broegbernensis]MBB6065011.1 protein TonB [Pseudoxanthomonas broegbernensis]
MAIHTPSHPAAPAEPQRADTARRTSPVLLAALAVALIAFGAWWYAQRTQQAPQAVLPTSPVLVEPAPGRTAAPAATARSTAPAGSQRASASVPDRAPRPLADNPVPRYPPAALRNGAEARVVLNIAVDANGVPTDVQVAERDGARDRELDRAAVQAARQWRFEPAMRDGRAVAATVRLPVDFRHD